MARSSNPSEKISKTPTEDTIDKCKLELCEEKVAANSYKDAKCTDVESKQEEKKYKICCLTKAQEAHHQYLNIDFCVATSAIEESKLIKDGIKNLVSKNGELEKMLKATTKAIKEVKTKLAEALDAACKFERCIEEEERCNPEILNALAQGIPAFSDRVMNIKENASSCYDKIAKGFDSAVNISGIQTFSNIGSFTPFGDTLCTMMDKYRANLDDNIKFNESQVKEAQTGLTDCIKQMTESKNEKCLAISSLSAAQEIYEYICNPGCEEDSYDKIKCICGEKPSMPPGTGFNECEEEQKQMPVKKDKGEWNM